MNKNEFLSYCKKALEPKKNDDLIKNIEEGKPSWNSQYLDKVYWYRVNLKEPIKYKNKTIFGFNIMPYQITINDIKNAEEKYPESKIKFNGEAKDKFKNELEKNELYVDYDSTSGNFHKNPNNRFQIVLLDLKTKEKDGGPGIPTKTVEETTFKKNREVYANNLCDEMQYFPNLDQENEKYTTLEGLQKLIDIVLNKLKEKK